MPKPLSCAGTAGSLHEEGEAHGHAIQVVEQITEQFNTLSKQYSDTLEELHLREKKNQRI
ncbi:hypothetical protein KAM479c_16330 (plasmid) [Aeromonas caviae]|nr:hypothetical protein KAM479c_16330 [Aeromonas caviae]